MVLVLLVAAEDVSPEYLSKSRRPTEKTFLDRAFYQEMVLVGVVITIMALAVYSYGLVNFDLPTARSLAFSFLVYAVLFRSFSCRSERQTFFEMKPNFYHLASVAIPIGLQLLIQHNDNLNDIFKIRGIPLITSLQLMLLGCVPVTIVEVYKIVKRTYEREVV